MKEKIMYLILGILIGAVITAGVFLVLQKNSKPPEMRDFDKSMNFDGERPKREDFENKIKDENVSEN